MKVRITARARVQVRGRKAWWAENRPAAPALFEEELYRTLRLISELPEAGVRWPTTRNPRLRRVLMTETHHHVYFYVDQPCGPAREFRGRSDRVGGSAPA